ncbi:MAG: LPS export ABC transporter permease LptF [Desulfovibrionaceae bacterium]|nr:LPS export ABC transporter permease LptF [Desulfovibrionaceae bacterium]
MSLLHRQILKDLASLFGLIVGCLLTLILLGRMLQLRDLFLSQNVSVWELARLFMYLTPFFLLLITPIACMLSVFLTFLRMSTDNELMALKASGIGLYRLVRAPLIFCLACTMLNFYFSFHGLSWGMDHFRSTVVEYARTRTKLAMQAGVFNQEFPGLTFYAHQVDNESGKMKFVFVQDRTHKDTVVNIVAPEGEVNSDPQKGQVSIMFRNGRIYRREGEKLDVLQFGSYSVRLPLGGLLAGYGIDPNRPSEMSWARLFKINNDPLELAKHDAVFGRKVLVEIYKRMTLPVGCFVLGLFALPVACVFRGLRQQYGLILSMGLFLVYYTLFSLGITLGESGALHPAVGLWFPNVLFTAAGVYGLRLAALEKNARVMVWFAHFRLRRRAA